MWFRQQSARLCCDGLWNRENCGRKIGTTEVMVKLKISIRFVSWNICSRYSALQPQLRWGKWKLFSVPRNKTDTVLVTVAVLTTAINRNPFFVCIVIKVPSLQTWRTTEAGVFCVCGSADYFTAVAVFPPPISILPFCDILLHQVPCFHSFLHDVSASPVYPSLVVPSLVLPLVITSPPFYSHVQTIFIIVSALRLYVLFPLRHFSYRSTSYYYVFCQIFKILRSVPNKICRTWCGHMSCTDLSRAEMFSRDLTPNLIEIGRVVYDV
jgi:hypothetical protein